MGLFILVAICFAFMLPPEAIAKKDVVPKTFIVNLDLPPQTRWANVIQSDKAFYRDQLQKVIDEALTHVPDGKLVGSLLIRIMSQLDNYLPTEYASEIRGIAQGLNITLGDVVLLNVVYDIATFCTSIVAQNSNGQIWHGRNMDYAFTDEARKTTIEAHFQKGGKTLYTATTFVGYVGILTGQRPYGFSISMDARHDGSFLENALMAILDRKAQLSAFLIRQTLEKSFTFDGAVTALTHADTIAPSYLIVGGAAAGQGAVVTRARLGAADVWRLEDSKFKWFLVETNYDHWKPPPKHDDRRDPAIKMMKAIGATNINSSSLYQLLSTPPVLRLDGVTIYTTVMSATTPHAYFNRIRYFP